MKHWVKYLLWGALWAGVAGYLVYALTLTNRHRSAQPVRSIEITVRDSTDTRRLISSEQIRAWIDNSGIETIGTPLSKVDMGGLEELILSHAFVDGTRISVNHSGVMQIDVTPRMPLVRLLFDGYDAYVTERGYVFPVPPRSAAYVPVVTGPYRPPFAASFTGDIDAEIERQIGELDTEIAALEKQKYPLYRRELQNDEELRGVRRMRVKRHWFEGDDSFAARVQRMRERRAGLQRQYRYEGREIRAAIDKIAASQDGIRRLQKKLREKREDFHNLLIFVQRIDSDDAWRDRIVQLIVRERESGTVEVSMVLREGGASVLFGAVDEGSWGVEEKLDALRLFFDDVLAREGWEVYKTIDVRYEGQVICS